MLIMFVQHSSTSKHFDVCLDGITQMLHKHLWFLNLHSKVLNGALYRGELRPSVG